MNLNEILGGAKKKNGESFSSNYHKSNISSPSSSSFSYIDDEDTQGSCSQPVYESKSSQIEPQNANTSEDDIELAVKRLISSEYNVPVEQLHSYTVLKDIVRCNIPMLCWKTEQAFNVNLAGKEKEIRTVGNLFNAVKRLNPSNYHKTNISSPSSSSFSYIDDEDTQGSCSQPVYESKASQIEPQNANISEDDIELAVKRLISSEYNVPVEQLHSYTVLKDIVRGNIPMLCWKTEQAFNVNLAGKEKEIRTVGNLFNAVKRLNPSNIVDYQPDDDYDDDCEYIQKEGECSEIEVEGVSYEYDEDSGEVTLKIKRIKNKSSETTGHLKIVCWVSEYRLEDEWQNDNYHIIGEEVQGALDSNHSYKDIEAEFQLDSEDIPETRWHFVFTINELNEDGNWYIIDQRNGECHLTSSDINTFISIFVEKLGVDSDDLKYGSHLENDLGADELDMVEIIMELEKEFGICIPDEEAGELQTVGDVFNYLENIL